MNPESWRAADQPRLLHVVCDGQPIKTRRYLVLSGVTSPSGLGVFNNSVRTVERALLERYFMVKIAGQFVRPILPQTAVFRSAHFTSFRDQLVENLRQVATVYSDVQTVALYTGPKRRLYENAMVSLGRVSVNKRDSSIRPFAKFEKQDLSKAPRIINPRSPRYNLETARFLKKLEKQVYSAINEAWGGHTAHTVIKGLNCFESASVIRDKWDRFDSPIAVGLDATKWDAHVSIEALRYEHSVYNGTFGSRYLKRLLEWQTLNRGKAYCPDGTVQFIMEGTRASGDINTSMGNCIIACAILYAYCQEIGIDAELCNNGDDCVIILEHSNLELFQSGVDKFYRKCGFVIEVEKPTDIFEQLEFCQTRPIFDGEQWRMMRNPLACLKKDGICLLPLNAGKAFEKWMGAVGECGLAAASGVPILQSWYAMFKRSGRKCSRRFRRHIFAHTIYDTAFARVAQSPPKEITGAARASFYSGTGIPPSLQIEYERLFDMTTLSSEVIDDPGYTRFDKCGVPIIDLAPDIFHHDNEIHKQL